MAELVNKWREVYYVNHTSKSQWLGAKELILNECQKGEAQLLVEYREYYSFPNVSKIIAEVYCS